VGEGNGPLNIRKAELRDVPALSKLITRYVAEQVLLPRPLANLYEDIFAAENFVLKS
jgi:N-acetylglutamate synthase-like GNAT family acetyltransferase